METTITKSSKTSKKSVSSVNSLFHTIRTRQMRRLISSNEYYLQRVNDMNGQIQFWKRSKMNAKTTTARNYCNLMINMYLNRYHYYINK